MPNTAPAGLSWPRHMPGYQKRDTRHALKPHWCSLDLFPHGMLAQGAVPAVVCSLISAHTAGESNGRLCPITLIATCPSTLYLP